MTCCYLRTVFTTALRSITCSVFYCIGVAVVNGWLLYRRRMGQKDVPAYHHLSLLKFQADIASPHYQSWKSLWGSFETKRASIWQSNKCCCTFQKNKRQRQCPFLCKMFNSIKLDTFPSFKRNNSIVVSAKVDIHT